MPRVDNVLFARSQMAMSLGFHIIFAAVGVAMPALMVVAEILWLRRKDPDYLELTRRWAKGTAVLFAVGAVSGTVLSFELGLLFPGFMRHAGAVIGLPFALEGFAFFAEAIFLGLYLYGWGRMRPWLHVVSGLLVAFSGGLSAVFVITANAWMNAPVGFRVQAGELVDIDPLRAMTTPFALHETVHMLVAAYMATAIAVAAVHAFILLRNPHLTFHRKALALALAVSVPMALVQPLVGDFAAKQVARFQPIKLAGMEGQFATERRAPLRVGGLPDEAAQRTRWALEIPGGLSYLAYGDVDAEVKGLTAFPRDEWPPLVIHAAFQVMVALGGLLALHSLWVLVSWLRRRALPPGRAFLWATVVAGPMGFLAIEAGWTVTEVGRQPWVIYQVLRTAHAATPMPGIVVPFVVFTLVYIGLSFAVAFILLRQVRASPGVAPARAAVPGEGR